ncbi:MAG: sensor histidine kinase [Peptostreptococcaceae bacterium]
MENVETINILNLMVVISIPIVTFSILNIKNDENFKNIIYIFISEIVINIFFINQSIFIYMIASLLILKALIFASKYLSISLIVCSCVFLLTKNELLLYTNLFINLYINNNFIINNLKDVHQIFVTNKSKIRENISHKKTLENVYEENENKQKEYSEYLSYMIKKIERAINKSEIPTFILDKNKELISYNKSFLDTFESEIDKKSFDFYKYLTQMFKNYEELIININKNNNDNINLEGVDNKIYKFTYSLDEIENDIVTICTIKDITQSTLIQNRLFDSEQRYKKLMDVLDEGIVILSESRVDYINDKAITLFGIENVDYESLLNKTKFKFLDKFKETLRSVENGVYNKKMLKIETKNDKILDLIIVNMVINNKNYVLIITIDVTELENTILKTQESEKIYKSLIQTLPEGIIILDKVDNTKLYKNESSKELIDIIGYDNLNLHIKRYLKEDEFGVFKKFVISKEKNLDILLAIINNEEEDNYVVVFRTLDYEYKINKINEELKNVEKDNKFKTDLMISIANDIENPLNQIWSAKNDILELDEKSDHIDNYTNLVYQNTNRLRRLLNNINEISMDKKYMKLEKKNSDIVDLVKNILNMSSEYINDNNLNYSFKNSIRNSMISIDSDKVERIILNILSNAIKYTKKGQIDICLSEYEGEVGINIKDTGVGIPKDRLDTIFLDFSQIDTTLSRGCEGTGIGLAVVKKLSDIHNIKINVSSEVGVGSEFEILIPKIFDEGLEVKNILMDKEKVDIEYADIYFSV